MGDGASRIVEKNLEVSERVQQALIIDDHYDYEEWLVLQRQQSFSYWWKLGAKTITPPSPGL